MALTGQSTRTCLLFSRLGREFPEGPGQRLWIALYSSLERLQRAAARRSTKAISEATKKSVVAFLDDLLEEAGSQKAQSQLKALIVGSDSPGRAFRDWWELGDEMEGGRGLAWVDRGPQALLRGSWLDKLVAVFSLGQLAFVFGQLRVAEGYVLCAFDLVRRANASKQPSEGLALRILEFLTVTLAIEVSFHADGFNSIRDEEGNSQAQRIFLSLTRRGSHYLDGFSRAADPELLRALEVEPREGEATKADGDARLLNFVQHFWRPIPSPWDLDLPLETVRSPRDLPPDALAYVLARRNLTGILQYRYRQWEQARGTFKWILDAIDYQRTRGDSASLVSLEHEAFLYLARLDIQNWRFDEAEQQIERAAKFFAAVADEFAANKAEKAWAELAFRRCCWSDAERLFVQVREKSLLRGFAHDYAAAEMFLAKILSRFGFQREATASFDRANAHFRRYDGLRETFECLFWHNAAEARQLALAGHPLDAVVTARALCRLYRRLFETIEKGHLEDADTSQSWAEEIQSLKKGLPQDRDPDLVEAMLDLRLGYFPSAEIVETLDRLVRRVPAEGAPWEILAERELSCQLLRLVRLQRPKLRRGSLRLVGEERADDGPPQLRRFAVRGLLIDAFEALVAQLPSAQVAALRAQEALRQARDLGLAGGLVPSLVDLSQLFVERDGYVALLLLLHEAIDRAISAKTMGAQGTDDFDLHLLERAFRSLTKYLVLERNFYAGPPVFAWIGCPELWKRLSTLYPRVDWRVMHEKALRGGRGLDYPDHAVATGWVEEVAVDTATLHVLWLHEYRDRPVTRDSFTSLEVPLEVVTQGHSASRLAPIVLVGRAGELDGGTGSWVAHHIPDLEVDELFRTTDGEATLWYRPRPAAWTRLVRRLLGQEPCHVASPRVSAREVEARYAEVARRWFGNRFPERLFERIFGIPPHEDEEDVATASGSRICSSLGARVSPPRIAAEPRANGGSRRRIAVRAPGRFAWQPPSELGDVLHEVLAASYQ